MTNTIKPREILILHLARSLANLGVFSLVLSHVHLFKGLFYRLSQRLFSVPLQILDEKFFLLVVIRLRLTGLFFNYFDAFFGLALFSSPTC